MSYQEKMDPDLEKSFQLSSLWLIYFGLNQQPAPEKVK